MRGLVKRFALALLLPAVALLYGGDVLFTIRRSTLLQPPPTVGTPASLRQEDSALQAPIPQLPTTVTANPSWAFPDASPPIKGRPHARVALLSRRPRGASQIRHQRSRLAHARDRGPRMRTDNTLGLSSAPSSESSSSSSSAPLSPSGDLNHRYPSSFVDDKHRLLWEDDQTPFSNDGIPPNQPSGPPNLENKLRAQGDLTDELGSEEEEGGEDTKESTEEEKTKELEKSLDVDVVTKFLKIVETQHLLGENCSAGTDLTLEEGVVDRYAQEKFRLEADVAVNRANFLTRLWKYVPELMLGGHYILYADIRGMIEFDDDIFAAGNCYDKYAYADYWLFCPFAYRRPDGTIVAKDLSVEYKYLSNTSEWFYRARKSAEKVIDNYTNFRRGYNSFRFNDTQHGPFEEDEILSVTYEDGKWSKPYFDCGGGNIWMMTYTVPFFGYNNGTYTFKGTSGIDIDLRRVDIDQCPPRPGSTELNIFAASDKCKTRTTQCVPIPGLGFRRGSYKCTCRDGFYFPVIGVGQPYYNGTVLEEEYEKTMLGKVNLYQVSGEFECLPCAEGCETCMDDRPCVVALNWVMRSAILALNCVIMSALPLVALFTWKYGEVKVVKAASPVLLRIIIVGAFLVYATIIVMYFQPTMVTCTMRVWLREIGFSLSYGALMLKTWRISVIFRVRSAKAVKITDLDLMKGLGFIVAAFAVFLTIRTIVSTPHVIVGKTADDLKAFLCSTDWWDHSFTIFEMMFLVWGIRLCIVVRKAPSEFNESKFISLAIYNEFLLSVFLNISMLFLQSPANPDLLFIIFFCHSQLTITLLLCLIFGSKAYMVLKGRGKAEDATAFATKPLAAKFLVRPKSLNSSTQLALSSTTSLGQAPLEAANAVLSEAEVQVIINTHHQPLYLLKVIKLIESE